MHDLAEKYYADSMKTVVQLKEGVEALMQAAMEQLVQHQIEYDTKFIHRVKVMRGETVQTDQKDAELDAKNAEILRLREELERIKEQFSAIDADKTLEAFKGKLNDPDFVTCGDCARTARSSDRLRATCTRDECTYTG